MPERYFSNSLLSIDKKKFFLFVGTVEKRKNVDIIISAFFKLKEQFSEAHDYKLVLAGREGYGYNEFTKRISESNFSTDVVFTGYISRGDCAKLYMETSAYIFPTIYEGFGSTQLECMAFNTPLILSDIPTNREVSQDYGIYFDLADIESLVSKMKTIVIGDFDENLLRLTAKRYLNRFTWDKSADEMISVYSNVVRENNE
ncbi:Mannosylfructose-phosphate synthase [bioreactor metagenome]|uniref:Mannosylfructose-phosphate synthase n=1 Tax=bioreactor metagenome TaxID=1076179 RepID=A0A645H7H0_9ZZZZ